MHIGDPPVIAPKKSEKVLRQIMFVDCGQRAHDAEIEGHILAVRCDENDVRPMGRNAHGVRGMMLDKGQHIISLLVAEDETQSVLTATENGYGKRTPIVEYTRHGRGTQGMIAIQQSARNGKVVAAALVRPDDEVMLISTGGVLIRTSVKSIREMSRSTQGVTLINLDGGTKLAGLERVVERDDEEE